LENFKGKHILRDPGVDKRILKYVLQKQGDWMWTRFKWIWSG